jgi:hypothetical protein
MQLLNADCALQDDNWYNRTWGDFKEQWKGVAGVAAIVTAVWQGGSYLQKVYLQDTVVKDQMVCSTSIGIAAMSYALPCLLCILNYCSVFVDMEQGFVDKRFEATAADGKEIAKATQDLTKYVQVDLAAKLEVMQKNAMDNQLAIFQKMESNHIATMQQQMTVMDKMEKNQMTVLDKMEKNQLAVLTKLEDQSKTVNGNHVEFIRLTSKIQMDALTQQLEDSKKKK